MINEILNERALDQRARRAAKRMGLVATKSRWRQGTIYNLGGFALVDPLTRFPVNARWDISAQDVIAYCQVK
jgi:hypothetical protein